MIRYLKRRTVAKTANYSVNPNKGDFSGTIFTTRGAGAPVTFTLPVPSLALLDTFYTFQGVADQNMIVDTGAAGRALTFNNINARSLASSTAGQKIGAIIEARCDGVQWLLSGDTVGVTYTVA